VPWVYAVSARSRHLAGAFSVSSNGHDSFIAPSNRTKSAMRYSSKASRALFEGVPNPRFRRRASATGSSRHIERAHSTLPSVPSFGELWQRSFVVWLGLVAPKDWTTRLCPVCRRRRSPRGGARYADAMRAAGLTFTGLSGRASVAYVESGIPTQRQAHRYAKRRGPAELMGLRAIASRADVVSCAGVRSRAAGLDAIPRCSSYCQDRDAQQQPTRPQPREEQHRRTPRRDAYGRRPCIHVASPCRCRMRSPQRHRHDYSVARIARLHEHRDPGSERRDDRPHVRDDVDDADPRPRCRHWRDQRDERSHAASAIRMLATSSVNM